MVNNIAHAMYESKKYNGALGYFAKLPDVNSKDAAFLLYGGVTFQKMGQKYRRQGFCNNTIAMKSSLFQIL
ncbi:MAG: hypothetical protein ABI288_09740 [Ginsengibacter sp.]